MNLKFVLAIALSIFAVIGAQAQAVPTTATATAPAAHAAKYGANSAAGGTFVHDGVRLYYEVYGTGEPLLLVHGNGASIGVFKAQIDYFRKRYRVIAMDSRDHGKSADSADAITYEKMTGDLAALLDHLDTGPAYVLGWSDGGIEALELGFLYPGKVKKIASMAANLDLDGLTPECVKWIHEEVASASADNTPAGRRELKVTQMMLDEPHIPLTALEKITAPTLIMASDHDLIKDEHTMAIYHHVPNGELAIFPNSTHMVMYDDSALFNATVDRFFRTPYVKRDRVEDVKKSFAAVEAGEK